MPSVWWGPDSILILESSARSFSALSLHHCPSRETRSNDKNKSNDKYLQDIGLRLMLIGRFDGACDPNPNGHAACACIVTRGDDVVFREVRYLGREGTTNNVAEFEGMKMILKWYLDGGFTEEMTVVGDSQIVIWRMLGKYRKPVTGACADVADECLALKLWLPLGRVTFAWQRREHNEKCDGMCEEIIAEVRQKARIAREVQA